MVGREEDRRETTEYDEGESGAIGRQRGEDDESWAGADGTPRKARESVVLRLGIQGHVLEGASRNRVRIC